MNPYADNDRALELGELTKERDCYKAMLDWLGDPRNAFAYSVDGHGQVLVKHPGAGLFPNLIAAIAYAREFQRQYPRLAGVDS
jgi:hypothetical protein